jgi:transcriptional regulator with XRE-family HTH domain
LDYISIMKDTPSDLNQRIAGRVRELRSSRGLPLEGLAKRSGVSRSMISLIERGESSPTAVVLEKLASALGVTLASLFDPPASSENVAAGPVLRRKDQPQWQDPASGYLRRNVTPPGLNQPMQIVEVCFPPRQRVSFDTAGQGRVVHQQIWMLEGEMNVTLGRERHHLNEGDCLAMLRDKPTMFYNPTRRAARYAVVLASEPTAKG